ncbi:diguanylate phosphodiesterase [Yersinia entomophaga]|uniref:Diguanylate phosphodiesterase n=1 Tax=Yersinia entomophaga TaxID=935293 RepID=A0ABM6BPA7_YERET|nr:MULTISPECIES: EAL domain-containing protein [Yersinia]ANI31426.1 diguanylate phosphodiesterase [Yersinia entomophaga]OWF90199.1 diguanylate phosphodiesterase [Yersinia entomophaga]
MKLNIEINCSYVCEPIYRKDGSLLAAELLSRFTTKPLDLPINPEDFFNELDSEGKGKLFRDQLLAAQKYSQWFIDNQVLLSINIDFDTAGIIVRDSELQALLNTMPFLRLELMETFSNLSDGNNNPLLRDLVKLYPLWLDDLGRGDSSLNAVTANIFEYVKIDKHFFWQHNKHTFPILINNVKKYCEGVIVVGVENQIESEQLQGSNIDAMQGYLFNSLTLDELTQTPR